MEDVLFIKVNIDGSIPSDENNDVFFAVSPASVQANNLQKTLSWGIYFVGALEAVSLLNINANVGEVIIMYKLSSEDGSSVDQYTIYDRVLSGYTSASLNNAALTAFSELGGIIYPNAQGGGGQDNNDGNGPGGSGNVGWWIGGALLLLVAVVAARNKEEEEDEKKTIKLIRKRGTKLYMPSTS